MTIGDIIKRIGKAVRNVFTKKATIESAFDTTIAVSGKMEQAINLWAAMYEGNPPWVDADDNKFKKTLNLPSAIAGEIARLVTMELEISITGTPMADYLDKQHKQCVSRARQYTEYACAKGGIVLKPFAIQEEKKISVSIIQAEDFYPTTFDSSGEITGAIFPDQKIIGNKKFTRLERHELEGTTCRITNKVFVTEISEISETNDNILGKEVELSAVPDWESIQPEVVIENIKKPLFAYFKMPMSNNVEVRSPLGVSVYSKAVDIIKETDNQWSSTLWEYYATQAAIFGDTDIFITDNKGNIKLDEREQRLYRKMESGEGSLLEFYNPAIRDSSLFNGLDKMLKQVEFQCSLAYGTISDPAETDKTATEVKQSKQRSFSLVCDIQKAFQTAHENLIYAMYALAILYDFAPDCDFEDIETMFDFDDSIVVDRDVEFARLMQLASANMIKPEAVTAWYFNISEEEAIKMLPDAFDDTKDDTNPEIEEE